MNNIHFIGYSAEHPHDFVYDFPMEENYLLLLTSTPAEFLVDGILQEYPAKSCIFAAQPGEPVCFVSALFCPLFPQIRSLAAKESRILRYFF